MNEVSSSVEEIREPPRPEDLDESQNKTYVHAPLTQNPAEYSRLGEEVLEINNESNEEVTVPIMTTSDDIDNPHNKLGANLPWWSLRTNQHVHYVPAELTK